MKLLRYSAEPFEFNPKKRYRANRNGAERDHKPEGFWLSVDEDWKRWCEGEEWGLDGLAHVTEFRLKPDAKILHIDSVKGLDEFTKRYGVQDVHELRSIDWRPVKEAYDGIIIAPYQWERRLSLMWYYTWDCASAVIWNLDAIERDIPPIAASGSDTEVQK